MTHTKDILLNCLYCNKSFWQESYLLKSGRGRHCSASCSAKTRCQINKHKFYHTKICDFCFKEFLTLKSLQRKFCSGSCSAKARPSRAIPPKITFFKNIIIPKNKNECWIYPKLIMKGYGHLWVDGKKYPAHRFSWEFHNNKKIPDGMYMCHKCDVKKCCNPTHLFVGTPSDNMQDMHNKGRGNLPSGEKHRCAKLTNKQAREIKILLLNDGIPTIIAQEYNVSKHIIYHIKNRKAYRHVKI